MSEFPPIGPSHQAPLQPSHSPSENVRELCNQMRTQAQALAEHLEQTLADPSLTAQESFLREVTTNGEKLNHTVGEALLVGKNAP